MSTPRPSLRHLPLAGLGSVRGGYVAPGRSDARPAGRFLALQARDIAPDGTILWATLSRVTPVFDPARYRVEEGDVLVPLRTPRPTAVVVRDVPADVIAVGHWAIISPEPGSADPDYLAWYLNHPTTAARLGGLLRGTKLKFLSLKELRALEVELPPLEHQRRIARAHALNERVTELERQLARARKELVDTLTMAALRRVVERERNG